MGIKRGLTTYGDDAFSAFLRRAFARATIYIDGDMQKPIIGICNTQSEVNRCHVHFAPLVEAVKRGVWQAGGVPLEFPTISLGEMMLNPTAMFFRNLMAMDTEEMLLGQPLDGVVLLGGCDKTVPAQLMGAASANIPAIMVTAGPMLNGNYEGRMLGACSDCRYFWQEHRAGTIGEAELEEIGQHLCPSAGTCMVMGTASTMAACVEALGMGLPGIAAVPAPDVRRLTLAEKSGIAIVDLVRQGLTPRRIMTREAFENAVRVSMACGGSTNAVIHLIAIAGRLGVDLTLEDFDRLSRETPLIANVRPAGKFQMEELAAAGGIPAVMKEMESLLHKGCLTVTGRTVGENLARVRRPESEYARTVIFPLDRPLKPEGGTAVLRGSLAPQGAVIKHAAATPRLLQHRGPACVFRNLEDLAARIDDPGLDVTPDSVLVLQNIGPRGGPGMPEAGLIPIPKKLLQQGARDMVRISDGRMSGTASGTIVLHVAPEAAVGGPLGLVRDGDWIALDTAGRRLELLVPEEELARRRAAWRPPAPQFSRGYGWLYLQHVLQADQGCDFDFCLYRSEVK